MKRLEAPALDSVQMVDALVADRQAGPNAAFFKQHAQEWKARVQTYMDTEGDPSANAPWPEIDGQRATFRNLYSHPQQGHVQQPILAAMRAHRLTECPACGDGGIPGTLDHYLPQEHYPHFAVLPHNLAPMCATCQLAKKAKTGDAQTPRYFLHPYFDAAADQQLVELTIQPPYNTPTHALTVRSDIAAPVSAVVTAHLRELEIHQRFGRYFITQYTRLLRNALFAGPNSWDHLFYAGVLANPELVVHLTTAALPAYP